MVRYQRVRTPDRVRQISFVAMTWGCCLSWAACQDSDPASPGPSPEDPTHALIFEGSLDGTSELLRWDEESRTVQRLLPAGIVAQDPAPSPDGSRIAFVVANAAESTGDIFVVRVDGSDLRQLTFAGELDDQPTWSPDGERIAFRSFRAGREGDIWVMDADGGDPINLTPDPLPGVLDERAPAWSPDGSRIAYAGNGAGNVDLWTMAPDGSDPRQITSTEDFDTEPAWAPDGMTLAFRRSNPTTGSEICVVAADGGIVLVLAQPGEQRQPVWTPDGSAIVFVDQESLASRPNLFRMRPDGTDVVPLVTDDVPGGCLNPAFLRVAR